MPNASSRRPVIFVLSVDTEEEFDWRGDFQQESCSVANVDFLPHFHEFCRSLGVKPTYLVDYPVAANERSASIIKRIAADGCSEVGAHLHPWCTPPFEGGGSERESHVINLSPALVEAKLDTLTKVIENNIGVRPRSFRTGRWGISGEVLQILARAGYHADASILPYYSTQYFSCWDACGKPYWPDYENVDMPGLQRKVFELPATAGFNRSDFAFWAKVYRILEMPQWRIFRPVGLAWHTHFLRKLYLSPELTSVEDMIALATAAVEEGHPLLQMFLHSSSFLPGKSEYTATEADRANLLGAISQVVNYLQGRFQIQFCTISEATDRLKSN